MISDQTIQGRCEKRIPGPDESILELGVLSNLQASGSENVAYAYGYGSRREQATS